MTAKQETTARRRRRSASEVQQIAAEFANSGMGRQEFCRSRGLSFSTLHRYLRKNEKQRRTTIAKNRLVAVEVVSNPQKGREANSGLALVLVGGHKIEVQSGFDEATLQRLVHLLERM